MEPIASPADPDRTSIENTKNGFVGSTGAKNRGLINPYEATTTKHQNLRVSDGKDKITVWKTKQCI